MVYLYHIHAWRYGASTCKWWCDISSESNITEDLASNILSAGNMIHPQQAIHPMHDDVIKWNMFRVIGPLCRNSPLTGEFLAQRPVMRSFHVFSDLRLNKRFDKEWWGWWFKTRSCPLWRHCNGCIRVIATAWRNLFIINVIYTSSTSDCPIPYLRLYNLQSGLSQLVPNIRASL